MKKNIIITGPALSSSGYGRMCRFAINSLSKRQDVELFLVCTNWGNTGNIIDDQNVNFIYELMNKTNTYLSQNNNVGNFDISIQVTIPNEWKKMAPINIGYTAGIETNFISPAWIEPSQMMTKIIVISEHAKSGFVDTVFQSNQGQQFKLSVPVEVCHFPFRDYEEENIDLQLKNDFNFLSICQWSPRKNLEQLICSFIEEFHDENVGLLLKVNKANDSQIDKESCERDIKTLVSRYPNKKCSVNVLHGFLNDRQMNSLYKNSKIKAIVSSTHGEGFGFPLFEAAYNELPVIATDWSGHLDFLSVEGKKMFAKVDYELKPLQDNHIWQGVLERGTSWAYPLSNSIKNRMREVYKDYSRFKSWSKKLNTFIRSEFTEEKVYNKFNSFVLPENLQTEDDIFSNFYKSN